jgi:hypothetical protein
MNEPSIAEFRRLALCNKLITCTAGWRVYAPRPCLLRVGVSQLSSTTSPGLSSGKLLLEIGVEELAGGRRIEDTGRDDPAYENYIAHCCFGATRRDLL